MIAWPDGELRELAAAAEEFARNRLAENGRRHDHHAAPEFAAVLGELRGMGYLGLCAGTRWGGLEQPAPALAAILEPVCAVDASAGAAIYANAAAHLDLIESAIPDERMDALADLKGAMLAWPAFHDLAEQSWPVVAANGELHGSAETLLPGASADWAIVPARSEADGKLSLVAANLRHPGACRGTPVRTIGLSACGIADVTFERAPAIRLAPEAAAIYAALAPKLAIAAIAMLCGVMRGSAETAAAYAIERHQGGGPIIGWGEVRRLLSLMRERLNVAQAILVALCDRRESDAADNERACYAALHAGPLACDLTADGVQLLGGNGYMKDYGQEKRMRDARQLQCLMGGPAWRRQLLMADGLSHAELHRK